MFAFRRDQEPSLISLKGAVEALHDNGELLQSECEKYQYTLSEQEIPLVTSVYTPISSGELCQFFLDMYGLEDCPMD